MSVERFLRKATDNLSAAEILLAEALSDAACNRAYYAIYNAARAALIAIDEEKAAYAKTHSGLLSQFSLYLTKTGLLDPKWSGIFAREERRRLLADYESEAITEDDAKEAVANAKLFIAAISGFVSERP